VTLGIPRLREILMTAAARIKTPVMTLPLAPGRGVRDARVVANRMRKLRLAECLAGARPGAAAAAAAGAARWGQLS
jgi:DNA-directed RNA polymerase I subunit RPA1